MNTDQTPRTLIKNLTKSTNPLQPSPFLPLYTSSPSLSVDPNTSLSNGESVAITPVVKSPVKRTKILEDFSSDSEDEKIEIDDIIDEQPLSLDILPASLDVIEEPSPPTPPTLEQNITEVPSQPEPSTPPTVEQPSSASPRSKLFERNFQQFADRGLLQFSPSKLNMSVDVFKPDDLLESVRKLREINKVKYERVSLPYKSTSIIEDAMKEKQLKISEKNTKKPKNPFEKKVAKKVEKVVKGKKDEEEEEKEVKKVVPQMPLSLTKHIFETYAKFPVDKEAYVEINKGVSMFFKQITKDLSVFSSHAKRNTIDASDVECLLRRQRFINDKTSLEDLIRTHLPMECIEELIPVAKAHNEVIPKVKHAAVRASQFKKKEKAKKEKQEEQEEEEPLERKSKKRSSPFPKSKVTRKSHSRTPKKAKKNV